MCRAGANRTRPSSDQRREAVAVAFLASALVELVGDGVAAVDGERGSVEVEEMAAASG
jgi:hypothetical protein